MTFVGASAMVNGRTQGAYPAAKAMLSAIYEGALVPFDTALRIEARWFTHVLMNPSSSAMIRTLFLSKQALEKGASRPALPDQSVQKLGVLGAGMMGAGIATVAASAGIEVVLLDRDQAAADKGKRPRRGLARRRRQAEAHHPRAARGQPSPASPPPPTTPPSPAATSSSRRSSRTPPSRPRPPAAPRPHLPADAIFATNTSTLPIAGLATASRDPASFIGIHFFSPVEKMALVEIIRGAATGDRAVAKALDFVRQIRKTPIVVNDARFFYANRCIIPYINEGVRMVAEGVEPALIENAARQLGMPLGPAAARRRDLDRPRGEDRQGDESGLGRRLPREPGRRRPLRASPTRAASAARPGAGFYAYDDKGKRTGLWPGLARAPGRVGADQPPLVEVQHRLAMIQALEAVRALEEGVLTDIREGDVGAILGWGFMPWSGGPFAWLDILGAARAVEIAEALAAAPRPALRARRRCSATSRPAARASTADTRRWPRGMRPERAPVAQPGRPGHVSRTPRHRRPVNHTESITRMPRAGACRTTREGR